jgi:hypothetical protein
VPHPPGRGRYHKRPKDAVPVQTGTLSARRSYAGAAACLTKTLTVRGVLRPSRGARSPCAKVPGTGRHQPGAGRTRRTCRSRHRVRASIPGRRAGPSPAAPSTPPHRRRRPPARHPALDRSRTETSMVDGAVASAVTARSSETVGMRNSPPSLSSSPAILVRRFPPSVRCHRASGPLVPALLPVPPRRRGAAHRAWRGYCGSHRCWPTPPVPADTVLGIAGAWTRGR